MSTSIDRLLRVAGAIALAALVGGTLLGAASAATSPADAAQAPAAATTPAAGEACQTYRAALAKALGVTVEALDAASASAASTTIDAAVADGRLTTAAGDRLKAKLASGPGDVCQRIAGRLDRASGALGVIRDGVVAAADTLKLTPAQLRAQLRSGTSLKAIASTQGVDYAAVSAAVTSAVKTDLDAAVAAGTIPQARADRILQRLAARLADGQIRKAP